MGVQGVLNYNKQTSKFGTVAKTHLVFYYETLILLDDNAIPGSSSLLSS